MASRCEVKAVRGLGAGQCCFEVATGPRPRAQVDYVLAMLNDLLDVSHIESSKLDLRLQAIPLADFLTEAVERHARLSARPTGAEKNTELGLAIARRVVEAHGGKIGVDTEPGRGAMVWFTLPATAED
jgi:signal transduction histidine kinase